MLPNATDPRWRKIVENPVEYKDKVSSLPTRILFGTLHLKSQRLSTEELVNVAYEFFAKNEKIVAEDITSLFG